MGRNNESKGRTRAVVVFDAGALPKAVVTTFVARWREKTGPFQLVARGPVRFSPELITHFRETLLPGVNEVVQLLSMPAPEGVLELSIANCDAASTIDQGLEVSGFSVDASAFIAMLSALLGVNVRQDVLVSGHVKSPAGDIGRVSSLAAKLRAAARITGLRRFLYAQPGSDDDTSLDDLAPEESQNIADATVEARAHVSALGVTNLVDVVREITTVDSLVMASLEHGYFDRPVSQVEGGTPLQSIAVYLANDNHQRFEDVLNAFLANREPVPARRLLRKRAQYHLARREYPSGLGAQLRSTLCSQPVSILRLTQLFPLWGKSTQLTLEKLATLRDYDDLRYLRSAVDGECTRQAPEGPSSVDDGVEPTAPSVLTVIMDELRHDNFTRKYAQPADAARLAHKLANTVIDSPDAFDHEVTTLMMRLLRSAGVLPRVRNEHVETEALGLVDRAFGSEGGLAAARVEAKLGYHGGMRVVLDKMTSRFIEELRFKQAQRVLQVTIEGRSWQERLDIAQELIQRLAPHVAEELHGLRAAQIVDNLSELILAYVRACDSLRPLVLRHS